MSQKSRSAIIAARFREAELREALQRFVKLERRILADLSTAHSLRGDGASAEMRADDRDDMAEAKVAFDAARKIIDDGVKVSTYITGQLLTNRVALSAESSFNDSVDLSTI